MTTGGVLAAEPRDHHTAEGHPLAWGERLIFGQDSWTASAANSPCCIANRLALTRLDAPILV